MTSEAPSELANEQVESTPDADEVVEVVAENVVAETEATIENEAESQAENEESEPQAEVEAPAEAEAAPAASGKRLSLDQIQVKQRLEGTVKRTELQGAIVDVNAEKNGLLHISQLSTDAVKNVTDVVKEGDTVTVYVLAIDRKSGRLDLTLIQPPAVTWNEIQVNQRYEGKVERIENYGVFVDIGAERPGLIHVSELADGFVSNPKDVVNVGDVIEAKVIGINKRKRQIDLSVRALALDTPPEEEEEDEVATAMEIALRKALDASGEGRRSDKKQRRKEKNRAAQDDIIARTLRMHQDG